MPSLVKKREHISLYSMNKMMLFISLLQKSISAGNFAPRPESSRMVHLTGCALNSVIFVVVVVKNEKKEKR